MSAILSINLILKSDCTLVAIDNSDYESLGRDLENHVMVEFLSYGDDAEPINSSIIIKRVSLRREDLSKWFSSEMILNADGTYSYYKLLIPLLEHFLVEGSDNIYNGVGEGELYIYNNILYKSNMSDNKQHRLDEILSASEIITNYVDAYNIVEHYGSTQTLYCPAKKVFSVCKLQKCLVSLQKQLLFSNGCNFNNCNMDTTLINRRDFLLNALYVFDYLKDMGNFNDAQRILDIMSTCDSICGDSSVNKNNNCGCGNFV